MTVTAHPALRVAPGVEAAVLAALGIRRPTVYVTPSVTPATAGCFLVVDSEGPHPHGQVVGIAIPGGDGWRLACTRCHGTVTGESSDRGWCRDCASDWASDWNEARS